MILTDAADLIPDNEILIEQLETLLEDASDHNENENLLIPLHQGALNLEISRIEFPTLIDSVEEYLYSRKDKCTDIQKVLDEALDMVYAEEYTPCRDYLNEFHKGLIDNPYRFVHTDKTVIEDIRFYLEYCAMAGGEYKTAISVSERKWRETEQALNLPGMLVFGSRGDVAAHVDKYLQWALQHAQSLKDLYRFTGMNDKSLAILKRVKSYLSTANIPGTSRLVNQRRGSSALLSMEIGNLLLNQGQLYEALKDYIEASLYRMFLPYGYSIDLNIGIIALTWGLDDIALDLVSKVIEIVEVDDDPVILIKCRILLGGYYLNSGDLEIAESYFQSGLDTVKYEYQQPIYNKEMIINEFLLQNNLATVLRERGDLPGALNIVRNAYQDIRKRIKRWMPKEFVPLIDMNTLWGLPLSFRVEEGKILYEMASFDAARQVLETVLSESERINNRVYSFQALYLLGLINHQLKEYTKSEAYLLRAIHILEDLRKTAEGENRRDFFSLMVQYYRTLADLYLDMDNPEKALEITELYKARYLSERMGAAEEENPIEMSRIKKLRESFDQGTILVSFADLSPRSIAVFILTKEKMYGLVKEKGEFLTALPEEIVSEAQQLFASLPSIISFNPTSIVNQHTREAELEARSFMSVCLFFINLLSEPTPDNRYNLIAQELYDFLFSELPITIEKAERLILIPDGILSLLPFETFISPDGNYLIEQTTVQYSYSLSLLLYLQNRTFQLREKPLLAFGGAVYEQDQGQQPLSLSKQEVLKKLETRHSDGKTVDWDELYSRIGIEWDDLPGTLEEVKHIGKLVKGSELVLGEKASEGWLKRESEKGSLKNYRCIHFATHALFLPEFPELSAVVLSMNRNSQEDGYLQMHEIEELNIQADVVVLSACETGLGKAIAGEGIVGLNQSFPLAGANATIASLWQVSDASTSLFMRELYRKVFTLDMTFADSLRETKLDFIRGQGDFSFYKHPFYWAPFIIYGLE